MKLLEKAARVAPLLRLTPFDAATPEGRSMERYRRILLTTASGVGGRVIGMAVSLATVPVVLGYLGKAEYGAWAIVTSFTTWLVFFDFGVLNGLVNALAEAYGRRDEKAAAELVSTAFWLLCGIALTMLAVLMIALPLVPWNTLFGVGGQLSPGELRWSVAAAAVPVIAAVPLSIVRQVYAGFQKTYVPNLFVAAGALLSLAVLLAAVHLQAGLSVIIFAAAAVGPLVSAVNLVYLLGWEMPWLRPRLSAVSRAAGRRLAATSVPLFLFQVGALLVNNTQLLVLGHRAALETVADYSIAMRLYTLLSSLIIMGTAAFVPSFREAYEHGDRAWVRRSFARMLGLRMALAAGATVAMAVAGDWLLGRWLGQADVRFGVAVWLALGACMLASTWVTAFTDLLTIMDRIWLQVGLVLLNGAVTVGLTWVLVPRMGLVGAVLALTATTALVLAWLVPLAARPLLAGAGAGTREGMTRG